MAALGTYAILILAALSFRPAGGFECPGYGRYADDSTKGCHDYVYCAKTTDGRNLTLHFTCPEGTLFNPQTSKCESEEVFKCDDLDEIKVIPLKGSLAISGQELLTTERDSVTTGVVKVQDAIHTVPNITNTTTTTYGRAGVPVTTIVNSTMISGSNYTVPVTTIVNSTMISGSNYTVPVTTIVNSTMISGSNHTVPVTTTVNSTMIPGSNYTVYGQSSTIPATTVTMYGQGGTTSTSGYQTLTPGSVSTINGQNSMISGATVIMNEQGGQSPGSSTSETTMSYGSITSASGDTTSTFGQNSMIPGATYTMYGQEGIASGSGSFDSTLNSTPGSSSTVYTHNSMIPGNDMSATNQGSQIIYTQDGMMPGGANIMHGQGQNIPGTITTYYGNQHMIPGQMGSTTYTSQSQGSGIESGTRNFLPGGTATTYTHSSTNPGQYGFTTNSLYENPRSEIHSDTDRTISSNPEIITTYASSSSPGSTMNEWKSMSYGDNMLPHGQNVMIPGAGATGYSYNQQNYGIPGQTVSSISDGQSYGIPGAISTNYQYGTPSTSTTMYGENIPGNVITTYGPGSTTPETFSTIQNQNYSNPGYYTTVHYYNPATPGGIGNMSSIGTTVASNTTMPNVTVLPGMVMKNMTTTPNNMTTIQGQTITYQIPNIVNTFTDKDGNIVYVEKEITQPNVGEATTGESSTTTLQNQVAPGTQYVNQKRVTTFPGMVTRTDSQGNIIYINSEPINKPQIEGVTQTGQYSISTAELPSTISNYDAESTTPIFASTPEEISDETSTGSTIETVLTEVTQPEVLSNEKISTTLPDESTTSDQYDTAIVSEVTSETFELFPHETMLMETNMIPAIDEVTSEITELTTTEQPLVTNDEMKIESVPTENIDVESTTETILSTQNQDDVMRFVDGIDYVELFNVDTPITTSETTLSYNISHPFSYPITTTRISETTNIDGSDLTGEQTDIPVDVLSTNLPENTTEILSTNTPASADLHYVTDFDDLGMTAAELEAFAQLTGGMPSMSNKEPSVTTVEPIDENVTEVDAIKLDVIPDDSTEISSTDSVTESTSPEIIIGSSVKIMTDSNMELTPEITTEGANDAEDNIEGITESTTEIFSEPASDITTENANESSIESATESSVESTTESITESTTESITDSPSVLFDDLETTTEYVNTRINIAEENITTTDEPILTTRIEMIDESDVDSTSEPTTLSEELILEEMLETPSSERLNSTIMQNEPNESQEMFTEYEKEEMSTTTESTDIELINEQLEITSFNVTANPEDAVSEIIATTEIVTENEPTTSTTVSILENEDYTLTPDSVNITDSSTEISIETTSTIQPETTTEIDTTTPITTEKTTIAPIEITDATTTEVYSETTTELENIPNSDNEAEIIEIETTTEMDESQISQGFKCVSIGRFPDPTDPSCNKYILCVKLPNGDFVQFKYSCLGNTYFNAVSQQCEINSTCSDTRVTTNASEYESPLLFSCTSIGRYPDPSTSDCSRYLMCVNAPSGEFIQYQYRCLQPYLFDPHLRECTLNYECSSSQGPTTGIAPPLTTPTTTTTTPIVPTSEFVCNSVGRFPDDQVSNCRGYIICARNIDGTFSKYNYMCFGGTKFNPYLKTCDENYICQNVIESIQIAEAFVPRSTTEPMTIRTTALASTNDPSIFTCTSTGRFLNPAVPNCSGYVLCLYDPDKGFSQYQFMCQSPARFDSFLRQCSLTSKCATERIAAPQAAQHYLMMPLTTTPFNAYSMVSNIESGQYACRSNGRFEDPQAPGCGGYLMCVRVQDGSYRQYQYNCLEGTRFNPTTMICSPSYTCPYA